MTIELVYDDILKTNAQVLVNPVNTVGVMGKGLAEQFKRAYPAMFREYQTACSAGWFHAGMVLTYLVPGAPARYILSAATKEHWRDPSSRVIVETCVHNIYSLILKYRFTSIAIPALGCGEGGMSWTVVQDIIYEGLKCFDNVQVYIYPPHMGVAKRRPVTAPPYGAPLHP